MSEKYDILDISAGYRSIVNGRQYDRFFTKPNVEDRIILDDGEVDDTVELMKKVVWKYLSDTKLISKELQAPTVRKTCENIWNFLYNHIQYRLDKKGVEQLRRPVRSWAERNEGIDCDCFSIFVSSILTNLQIPHKFRITKYGTSQAYQHVYVIVPQLNQQPIIIDCVLSKFNFEKQYSQHKDFTMSINGINVAVLSGIQDEDNKLFDLLSGLDGLGELTGAEQDRKIYNYLIKTRDIVASNPQLISTVDYPPAYLAMLNYAIDNWNTPNREKALRELALREDEINQMNGYDDYSVVDGLDGFDLGATKPKPAKKAFFKKVGEAAKKGGKLFVRFDPLTISARGGFLLAMKMNLKKMSSKIKWAYATKEQAAAKGVSQKEWEKAKNALTKIEKLFVNKLQGKKEALKNAILKGKGGGLTGIEDDSVDGLGVLPAVALAAAVPVITAALKILVDSGIMKKEEAEGIKAEIKAKTGEANTMAKDPVLDGESPENGAAASSSSSAAASGGSGETTGIIAFVKKQPVLAIAGAGLGIFALVKLFGSKKKSSNGVAGVSSKRKAAKSKPKTQAKKLVKAKVKHVHLQ